MRTVNYKQRILLTGIIPLSVLLLLFYTNRSQAFFSDGASDHKIDSVKSFGGFELGHKFSEYSRSLKNVSTYSDVNTIDNIPVKDSCLPTVFNSHTKNVQLSFYHGSLYFIYCICAPTSDTASWYSKFRYEYGTPHKQNPYQRQCTSWSGDSISLSLTMIGERFYDKLHRTFDSGWNKDSTSKSWYPVVLFGNGKSYLQREKEIPMPE